MKKLLKVFVAIGFAVLLLFIYTKLSVHEIIPVGGFWQTLPVAVLMAGVYYLIFERKK